VNRLTISFVIAMVHMVRRSFGAARPWAYAIDIGLVALAKCASGKPPWNLEAGPDTVTA
jgi:hypothetical protein